MEKKLKKFINDLNLLQELSLATIGTVAALLFAQGILGEQKGICIIVSILLAILSAVVYAWQLVLSGLTLDPPDLRYRFILTWAFIFTPVIFLGLFFFKMLIAELICGAICYATVNYLIFRKITQPPDERTDHY